MPGPKEARGPALFPPDQAEAFAKASASAEATDPAGPRNRAAKKPAEASGKKAAKAAADVRRKRKPAIRRSPASNRQQSRRGSGPRQADAVRAVALKPLIARHASENGLPYDLADAVVRIESRYNAGARNGANIGLTQINVRTAQSLGYQGEAAGLLDAETNLRYGLKYLAQAYRLAGGDTCGTILRYQAGHRAQTMTRARRGSIAPRSRRSLARCRLGLAALTPTAAFCTTSPCQPAGRPLRARAGEESPGSMEARCRITSGGGDPRESATESKPPLGPSDPGVRVKGCGKSAPRTQQCGRHGKPHREQNRIGTTGARARPVSRLVVRVGCSRRSATVVPEEWPPRSSRRLGPYRTRLTGRLTLPSHLVHRATNRCKRRRKPLARLRFINPKGL